MEFSSECNIALLACVFSYVVLLLLFGMEGFRSNLRRGKFYREAQDIISDFPVPRSRMRGGLPPSPSSWRGTQLSLGSAFALSPAVRFPRSNTHYALTD